MICITLEQIPTIAFTTVFVVGGLWFMGHFIKLLIDSYIDSRIKRLLPKMSSAKVIYGNSNKKMK